MAVVAPVGKDILPGGRGFLHVLCPTPESGDEERSNEVPEPGRATWFAEPLRFNEAAQCLRESCSHGSTAGMGPLAACRT